MTEQTGADNRCAADQQDPTAPQDPTAQQDPLAPQAPDAQHIRTEPHVSGPTRRDNRRTTKGKMCSENFVAACRCDGEKFGGHLQALTFAEQAEVV